MSEIRIPLKDALGFYTQPKTVSRKCTGCGKPFAIINGYIGQAVECPECHKKYNLNAIVRFSLVIEPVEVI